MKLSDPIRLPSGVASLLNLHIAGVALLVVLNITLLVKLGFAWSDLGSRRQEQLQQKQLQLAQLQVQATRLNGLPQEVEQSRHDADLFYAQRVPPNYSTFLAEIGALVTKNNVRFTRAGYTQAPAIAGLAEVRIDANLAGQYTDVMHFINDLETGKVSRAAEKAENGLPAVSSETSSDTSADRAPGKNELQASKAHRPFFVISALTLTGQQGGQVNLRLRLTTYLHAADASQLPPSSGDTAPEDGPPAAASTDQSALRMPAPATSLAAPAEVR